MLFLPPLIQLMIFGFAVNLDVDSARIGWMDQDQTSESRQLRSEFEGSGRFEVAALPESEKEMQNLLDRGQVLGVVRVLPGFARDIQRGRATSVQVLLDGSNSNEASIVSSYAAQTIGRFSSKVAGDLQRDKLMARSVGMSTPVHVAAPQIEARSRVWFNPDLRSRNYFIPGVVVNIITLVTLSLTAMVIAGEKEIATIQQLLVSPIRLLQLILTQDLPFAFFGLCSIMKISPASFLL